MRAPYGLNIRDNRLSWPHRPEPLFCNLGLQATPRLNQIKSTAVYPNGAMLLIEGQHSRGVFVLCTGKVKLSTTSREGKNDHHENLRFRRRARTGCRGLRAAVRVTADMMQPGQANLIPRESLLHFLKEFPEVALRVASS